LAARRAYRYDPLAALKLLSSQRLLNHGIHLQLRWERSGDKTEDGGKEKKEEVEEGKKRAEEKTRREQALTAPRTEVGDRGNGLNRVELLG
jgi:hypothetical protein